MIGLGQARLVNEPFGEAALYLDLRFARRALLFDLGDLTPLAPRNLLRVSHAFVSHTHMDHFSGFDRLLGIRLGREPPVRLYGPPGFADRVEHKLGAYTWNLVPDNPTDFVISALELHAGRLAVAAEFHSRDAFRRRTVAAPDLPEGVLLDEDEFKVMAVTLDHGTPSLAFALEEKLQVNVWKDRLRGLGLPVGPWLREFKDAVRRGCPDNQVFTVSWKAGGTSREVRIPLGDLKAEVLRVAPGAKLAYVVDAAYHEANASRIVALARGADVLFVEAVFLAADAAIAAERRHLTAAQAGALARAAGVKRVVPFHFSPRYRGREEQLREEVADAFESAGPLARLKALP
jgi:ribonuclease Z